MIIKKLMMVILENWDLKSRKKRRKPLLSTS